MSHVSSHGPRSRYSRLLVPKRAADDAVVGLLSLHAPLGFESAGKDLVAFFRSASDARRAAAALTRARVRHELATDLPESDPLEAWRAASRPFAVGRRLWVEPGDADEETGRPPDGRIALRLPASRAFGTGEHASTRLALLAVEEEDPAGRAVLDVGTGSGILAVTAARLGVPRVFAFDDDPDAVAAAVANAARNHVAERVRCELADAATVALDAAPLVLANLLAAAHERLAPRYAAWVAPGGALVLGGLLDHEAAAVSAAVTAQGFQPRAGVSIEGWTSLELTRAPVHARA